MPKMKIISYSAALTALALLAACGKKEQPAPPTAPEKPVVTATPAPAIQPPKPEPAPETTPEKPAQETKPATVSTLAAYFHFDEDRPAKAVSDSSERKRSARLNEGASAGAAGLVKGALDFAAARNGQVTLLDPLDFATNTATVVAWVKRRGPQQNNAALFFARGGESAAGLLVGKNGELSYVWGREQSSAGWISGLVLPDNAWAFVALVAEPDRATLYLGVPGEPLWAAENPRVHIPADFASALTLGRDPILDASFNGALDEFGIWKNSMTRADVEKLFLIGQKLAAAQTEKPAAAQTAKPTPPPAVKPTTTVAGWNVAEFEATARRYNDAVTAFTKFLQTRENPASLKKIEAEVRACSDTFEKLKAGAPASLDLQTYVDRCNKLNFDIHAAKTLVP